MDCQGLPKITEREVARYVSSLEVRVLSNVTVKEIAQATAVLARRQVESAVCLVTETANVAKNI